VREDELVEKQFRKVENRLEADYANLHAEIKELKERQCHDEWTIGGQRMLESPSGMGSFSSLHLNGAQLDAFEALGRN